MLSTARSVKNKHINQRPVRTRVLSRIQGPGCGDGVSSFLSQEPVPSIPPRQSSSLTRPKTCGQLVEVDAIFNKSLFGKNVKRPRKYIFFGQAILSLHERIQGVLKNTAVAKMCVFIVTRIGNCLKITGWLSKSSTSIQRAIM